MKSQAKVKSQRRIKNIPLYLGFRHRGLITHQIGNDFPSARRNRVANRIKSQNRRMNRTSK